MGDGGQKIVLHRFRNENALQKTRKLKIILQEETGEGRKMFQNLVFPKTIFTTIFNCFGVQKCKFSDEIKTPKGSIDHFFDTYQYYLWLYSVCDQKPVFTPDFAIRILTFCNFSWLLSTGLFCLEDVSQPWEYFLYIGSSNSMESLHVWEHFYIFWSRIQWICYTLKLFIPFRLQLMYALCRVLFFLYTNHCLEKLESKMYQF